MLTDRLSPAIGFLLDLVLIPHSSLIRGFLVGLGGCMQVPCLALWSFHLEIWVLPVLSPSSPLVVSRNKHLVFVF